MKSVLKILWCVGIVLNLVGTCQAKEWRGIKPLYSTRADVERIFGPSIKGCKTFACIYELSSEIVFIHYANGAACGDESSSGWKVPINTVIEITVHFKTDRPLADFQIDESKYEKETDPHQPGWIYYTNREEGIKIGGGWRTVTSISYFAEANDKGLNCPERAPNKSINRTRN